MNKLHKVLDYLTQYRKALGYSTVSLLMVGIEQIFSSVVFKCPCNSASGNMLYGFSFLLAPAFILFLLGYMANAEIWLLVTGKCSREKHLQRSAGRACPCLCQFLQLTAKASVAPLTWIVVALLGANFYECAASGTSPAMYYFCKENRPDCPTQLIKTPCDKELSANITSEQLSLQAQSQVKPPCSSPHTMGFGPGCSRCSGALLTTLNSPSLLYCRVSCTKSKQLAKIH